MVGLRTIVIEVKIPSLPSRVDEVVTMARSIGYDVVDCMVQKKKV